MEPEMGVAEGDHRGAGAAGSDQLPTCRGAAGAAVAVHSGRAVFGVNRRCRAPAPPCGTCSAFKVLPCTSAERTERHRRQRSRPGRTEQARGPVGSGQSTGQTDAAGFEERLSAATHAHGQGI